MKIRECPINTIIISDYTIAFIILNHGVDYFLCVHNGIESGKLYEDFQYYNEVEHAEFQIYEPNVHSYIKNPPSNSLLEYFHSLKYNKDILELL